MHGARAWLIWLALLPAVAGCKRSGNEPPTEGAWRDQFVFVGDGGNVLVLGIHRQANGTAEAKLWHGDHGTWKAVLYQSFDVPRRHAAKLSATLKRLGKGVRASVTGSDKSLGIELRTPSRALSVSAEPMHVLGETRDPEGVSRYRAGRALVQDGDTQRTGWLIAERTPAAKPRAPFVDYGDFVFVIVASKTGGVRVAKRSRRRPPFDHGFHLHATTLEHTTKVDIAIADTSVSLRLGGGAPRRYPIADRNTSKGVSPNGAAVVYETLLLGGAERGVAFVIRPAKGGER